MIAFGIDPLRIPYLANGSDMLPKAFHQMPLVPSSFHRGDSGSVFTWGC